MDELFHGTLPFDPAGVPYRPITRAFQAQSHIRPTGSPTHDTDHPEVCTALVRPKEALDDWMRGYGDEQKAGARS